MVPSLAVSIADVDVPGNVPVICRSFSLPVHVLLSTYFNDAWFYANVSKGFIGTGLSPWLARILPGKVNVSGNVVAKSVLLRPVPLV